MGRVPLRDQHSRHEQYWLGSFTDFTAPIHGALVRYRPRMIGVRMNFRFKD